MIMQSLISRSTVSLLIIAAFSWCLNTLSSCFESLLSAVEGDDFGVGLRFFLIEKDVFCTDDLAVALFGLLIVCFI